MRLLELFGFPGMNFATTPVITPGGGGDAGTGAGSGGGTPAGGGGAPSPAPVTPAAVHPADSGNIAQLRTAYDAIKTERDTLKSQWEPWSKVAGQYKPDQITQFSTVHTKVYSQAAEIGKQLGYPDNEITEALMEDPVATLDFLRNEAFAREGGNENGQGFDTDQQGNLQNQINAALEREMGPIKQRENQRMTQEANQLFERTVHSFIADDFKKLGIDVGQVSPDEMEMLMTATSEVMKYDDQSLHALKFEGKAAPVQKAYEEAKTFLDKYFVARTSRERTKAGLVKGGQPGQPAVPSGGKRPTLDEMIDDPGRIAPKYA